MFFNSCTPHRHCTLIMSWVGVGVGGVLTALMFTCKYRHCTLSIWGFGWCGVGVGWGANNVHVHLQTQALHADHMVGVVFGVVC